MIRTELLQALPENQMAMAVGLINPTGCSSWVRVFSAMDAVRLSPRLGAVHHGV
jgi:hypothetical protein